MSVAGFRASMYEGAAHLAALEAKNYKLADRLAEREAEIDNWAIEIEQQQEYIDLLENQVIASMTEDEPIPFLPADPEEQRRRDTTAADGSRAMIYRTNGQP